MAFIRIFQYYLKFMHARIQKKNPWRGDPEEYPNLQGGGGGGCPIFDNNFPARPSLDPRMLYILAILLHIDFITYALDP